MNKFTNFQKKKNPSRFFIDSILFVTVNTCHAHYPSLMALRTEVILVSIYISFVNVRADLFFYSPDSHLRSLKRRKCDGFK